MPEQDAEIIDELPVLEIRCDRCDGRGRFGAARWQQCDWCDGTGYQVTEFGERVLTLMRHSFRSMLKDVVGD